MKNNIKKLLAYAVSCVMLVSLLAIGTVSAAAAEAVGTAVDPADYYEKEVAITNANVTLPEGTALGNGKTGAWITPYYGLVIPGDAADNYTFGAGAITIDLGEAFKAICLDVAENIPEKGNKKWDAIEVSANGTDWFPLNATRIISEKQVGATNFNMRAVTYSATLDAEAGYRYVRLTQNAPCAWNFICPAIAAIKYDPSVSSNTTEDAPPAVEGWEPDLSENATEVNYDMPNIGMLEAPYSYGFSGAGNPNQGGSPSAARAQDVEYIGTTHTWMVTTGHTGVTRFAFSTNAAKDFTITLRIYTKDVNAGLNKKIRVYACEGFEGGSYGGISGDKAHQVDPATPINPVRLAVAFEEAEKQPIGPDWRNICVVAAGDIPTNATNLYIELDGLGNGWEIGLIDFDYVSDPIVIEPLPDFIVNEDLEEFYEDLASERMMQEAIFAIDNLIRETKKYGTFNEYDDMLVLKELGSEGSVIYNFNGLKTIDVRGWVKDTIKAELPISIKVSADGKTWTDADATVRLSQAFNEFSTFSLLVENVADGMNFVKLVIENDEAVTAENISISDMQFLYTNEAPVEDDPTEDNPEDDDNKTEENPDTGVATSAAAVILATLSGAATVISKRRR